MQEKKLKEFSHLFVIRHKIKGIYSSYKRTFCNEPVYFSFFGEVSEAREFAHKCNIPIGGDIEITRY